MEKSSSTHSVFSAACIESSKLGLTKKISSQSKGHRPAKRLSVKVISRWLRISIKGLFR